MGKYDRLGAYLRQQDRPLIPLTFAQIEQIVGIKLPKSQNYQAWWSNSTSNNVMTQVWLDAGYRTEQVDTAGKQLMFRRVAAPSGMQENRPVFQHTALLAPGGRHPIFGALKDTFTIQAGYSLEGPVLDEGDLRALEAGIEQTAALIEQGLAAGKG